MTSGSTSKKRRQLNATIPPDKQSEMKEAIRVLAHARTTDIHKLSIEESTELNKIKNRYKEQRIERIREFERARNKLIEKYEEEFGRDAVKYQLVGMGVLQ